MDFRKVESKSTSENVTDKGDAEGGDNSCDAEKEADNGLGDADVWTQEKLLKESRKFNIDIAPKVV